MSSEAGRDHALRTPSAHLSDHSKLLELLIGAEPVAALHLDSRHASPQVFIETSEVLGRERSTPRLVYGASYRGSHRPALRLSPTPR